MKRYVVTLRDVIDDVVDSTYVCASAELRRCGYPHGPGS